MSILLFEVVKMKYDMMIQKFLLVLLVCVLISQGSFGAVWDSMANYQYGDDPNPCDEITKLIQETPANQYVQIEQKLIAVVSSKSATPTGKAESCRFLQQVGSKKCIGAMSGLLGDEKLSHSARLVLERLHCEEANAALRGALATAPDKVKIGILGSLGSNGDVKTVKPACKLAHSSNPALAQGAIETLGMLGGKEAARCLSSLKPGNKLVPIRMRALTTCARSLSGSDAVPLCEQVLAGTDGSSRIAALKVLAAADETKATTWLTKAIKGSDIRFRRGAIGIVADTKGERLTGAMLALANELRSDRKAELITALGVRGDKAALGSLQKHVLSKEKVIRIAAVKAVSKLGDAKDVPLLLGAADSPDTDMTVTHSIAGMKDDRINQALVEALADRKLRKAAIHASIARGSSEVVPVLMKLAGDSDPDVRKESWNGLAALATAEDMNSIMKIAANIKESKDFSYAEGAIKKVFSRAENKGKCFEVLAGHYGLASEATKGVILDLGAATGNANALQLERTALTSGNRVLYSRALRALAKWPNESAADDLLRQASSAAEKVDRIVALRGYIQIAGMEKSRLRPVERMNMIQTALNLVQRDEEMKQIVSALKHVKSPKALEMLKQYMENPTFRAEAEMSAVNLISSLRKSHPQEVREIALRLTKSKNRNVVKKAKKTLSEMK